MAMDYGFGPTTITAFEVDKNPDDPKTGDETFGTSSGMASDMFFTHYYSGKIKMPAWPTWVKNAEGTITVTFSGGSTALLKPDTLGDPKKTANQKLIDILKRTAKARVEALKEKRDDFDTIALVVVDHIQNNAEISATATVSTSLGNLQRMSNPVVADANTQAPSANRFIPVSGVVF